MRAGGQLLLIVLARAGACRAEPDRRGASERRADAGGTSHVTPSPHACSGSVRTTRHARLAGDPLCGQQRGPAGDLAASPSRATHARIRGPARLRRAARHWCRIGARAERLGHIRAAARRFRRGHYEPARLWCALQAAAGRQRRHHMRRSPAARRRARARPRGALVRVSWWRWRGEREPPPTLVQVGDSPFHTQHVGALLLLCTTPRAVIALCEIDGRGLGAARKALLEDALSADAQRLARARGQRPAGLDESKLHFRIALRFPGSAGEVSGAWRQWAQVPSPPMLAALRSCIESAGLPRPGWHQGARGHGEAT